MKFLLLCLSCCVLNAQTITNQPADFQALPGQPRVIQIFRQPPLAYPYDKSWAVSVYWDKDGNHYTDASISIVGRHEDTPDSFGHYPIRRPAPNYMLGIWSDVNAPSIVVRGNQLPGSCVLVVLDPRTGQENLRVNNDGTIWLRSLEMAGPTTNATVGKDIWTIRGGIIREIKPRRVTLPPTTLMRGKHIERRRP